MLLFVFAIEGSYKCLLEIQHYILEKGDRGRRRLDRQLSRGAARGGCGGAGARWEAFAIAQHLPQLQVSVLLVVLASCGFALWGRGPGECIVSSA